MEAIEKAKTFLESRNVDISQGKLDSSGLWYVDVVEGDGNSPTKNRRGGSALQWLAERWHQIRFVRRQRTVHCISSGCGYFRLDRRRVQHEARRENGF